MSIEQINTEIMKHLSYLKLNSIKDIFDETEIQTINEKGNFNEYFLQLLQHEYECRSNKKISNLRRMSKIPLNKTFDTFDSNRLSQKIKRQVKVLCEGKFIDNNENILIFGNPGSGKSHLLWAICHELISHQKKIINTDCSLLVQELLREKKDYRLEKVLKRYSKYDGVMIDDIGYTQQTREEMEVFFNFLSSKYETGSVFITSNLPFSKWTRIFKDSMTAAAAVDRLIHHSLIIELNLPSYRLEEAKKRK